MSSSGPKMIADMNFHNVKAAHAKLVREAPERRAEIAGLAARLAELEANPPPADQSIGANHPPEPLPPATFEEHAKRIDDLYTEAKNWADGAAIENDAQAAEVDRLIDLFKDAIKAAETTRDAEIEPLSEQVKAIRERYYPLLADTTKLKGRAIIAKAKLLEVKTRWGPVLRARQDAEAERLRKIAAEAAAQLPQKAAEAVGNIEATEAVEDLITTAQQALRGAKAAEKPITGGFRDSWEITGWDDSAGDGRVVLMRHVFKTDLDALVAFCQEWARAEIRRGIRTIPGLVINNNRKAF
jgi:hypothetical protein